MPIFRFLSRFRLSPVRDESAFGLTHLAFLIYCQDTVFDLDRSPNMPADKAVLTASLLSSAMKRPYEKPVLVILDSADQTFGKPMNNVENTIFPTQIGPS